MKYQRSGQARVALACRTLSRLAVFGTVLAGAMPLSGCVLDANDKQGAVSMASKPAPAATGRRDVYVCSPSGYGRTTSCWRRT